MTEGMKNWIIAITACALILAALESLVPKGAVKKTAAFAGGMLMLLVLLQPITARWEVRPAEWLEAAEKEREDYAQALTRESRSLLEKLIAEESQAYILEWAEELGLSCRVSVGCRSDENGLSFPHEVTVISPAMAEHQRQVLSERIETELGIAKERQNFREEGSHEETGSA